MNPNRRFPGSHSIRYRAVPLLLMTALATATAPALADPLEAGADLHQAHCVSCHGTEVYTREGRMIGGWDQLESQVQRCETNLGLRWFEDDVGAVARYLNHHFYQFAQ